MLLELWPKSQRDVQRLQLCPLLRLLLPAQRLGEASPHLQPWPSGSTQTSVSHRQNSLSSSSRSGGLSRQPLCHQNPWQCTFSVQPWRREGLGHLSILHSCLERRGKRTLGRTSAIYPQTWKQWISIEMELFVGEVRITDFSAYSLADIKRQIIDDCLSDMSTGTSALARTQGSVSNASIGWTDLRNRWKRVCHYPKPPNLDVWEEAKKLTSYLFDCETMAYEEKKTGDLKETTPWPMFFHFCCASF